MRLTGWCRWWGFCSSSHIKMWFRPPQCVMVTMSDPSSFVSSTVSWCRRYCVRAVTSISIILELFLFWTFCVWLRLVFLLVYRPEKDLIWWVSCQVPATVIVDWVVGFYGFCLCYDVCDNFSCFGSSCYLDVLTYCLLDPVVLSDSWLIDITHCNFPSVSEFFLCVNIDT